MAAANAGAPPTPDIGALFGLKPPVQKGWRWEAPASGREALGPACESVKLGNASQGLR